MNFPDDFVNKIVLGDCAEVLKEIPNNSIDCVLTDPPYNIDLAYHKMDDKQSEEVFWKFIEGVYTDLYRVLKDKCHLTFTCSQKQVWIYRPMLEKMGFVFRHMGVWHNPKRKAGSYPGQWAYGWEPILDFTKGEGFRKLNNGNSVGFTDVWIEEEPAGIMHPAKRPVKCWQNLVELMSDKNELVLDPFNGSGTTPLVCQRTDRRYIGIEIDAGYIKMTENRLGEFDDYKGFE